MLINSIHRKVNTEVVVQPSEFRLSSLKYLGMLTQEKNNPQQ